MDVSKKIEATILNYFSKKAEYYGCSISSLSILAEIGNRLEERSVFALYKDGKFLAWVDLDQLLDNLPFLERLIASNDKVSRIFFNSIDKYEQEYKVKTQIAIYSNLEYFALANYKKQKQITINDII